MPNSPLPPELHGLAIRTSTGADHGVSRKRLRAADVQHPFHAVSAVGLDLDDVRDRATAFLPAMEAGQTFSHTTALALHGAPLPHLPADLHVSVEFPRTPPRRTGVVGHALASAPATLLVGMPVAPPLVAWGQSAALLGREDLVAVADHLVFAELVDLEDLARIAEAWRGRPGAGRLTWAAARARSGVRPRPETLVRLLLVRSGLPEPVVAHPVEVVGWLVLHPDLSYPERRLALGYEGDGHRSRREWERDIERRELLADARWRTIRITAAHLFRDPRGPVAASGGTTPADPDDSCDLALSWRDRGELARVLGFGAGVGAGPPLERVRTGARAPRRRGPPHGSRSGGPRARRPRRRHRGRR